jgi:SET domain-containing protein
MPMSAPPTSDQTSGVRVGEGRHGRGVFAARPIATGETIEVCPTLEVAAADVGGLLHDYVFESNDDAEGSVLLLGYGMLYNHSAKPNAEYVQDGDAAVAFVALRPIKPGDEITIDYGADWWATRDRKPD